MAVNYRGIWFITLAPGVIFTNVVMVEPIKGVAFYWLHSDA